MSTFPNSPLLSNQNIRIITRLRGPQNQISNQLINPESKITSSKSPNKKIQPQKKNNNFKKSNIKKAKYWIKPRYKIHNIHK